MTNNTTKSELCECAEPGYCPRYQREQKGRFWEICAGINCDLGTSAAFREQWKSELSNYKGRTSLTVKTQGTGDNRVRRLQLVTAQAPGDAVVMTSAIYSLHIAHPGKYLTSVSSPYPEVFENNPHVSSALDETETLHMHYPAINDCNKRGIHFMQGWCEFLGSALGIHVPLMTNRPHLYFRNATAPTQDYWVVCSGGKRDFTSKMWGHHNYQHVVSYLKKDIRFVQVGSSEHEHRPLYDLYTNAVGKTSLRSLFELVRRSRGVLCGVSLLMHVAAALNKPAIVIAGGREPVQWNAYPKQHYLHTIGELPCSDLQGNVGGACWRSRVVPLGDNKELDNQLCERPVEGLPECMRLINPSHVADLILRYNKQYETGLSSD